MGEMTRKENMPSLTALEEFLSCHRSCGDNIDRNVSSKKESWMENFTEGLDENLTHVTYY